MNLAVKWNNEHKQRWANIDRLAEQNRWNRKAKAEVLIAPKPEPIQEQQITKHKPFWFSIVRSVKLNRLGGPPIKEIQRATCEVYGIALNDLLSERRTANLVLPRHVSLYLARELTALSWARISGATGDRDHTVAIHAHSKIARLLKSDDRLAARIALIKERIG